MFNKKIFISALLAFSSITLSAFAEKKIAVMPFSVSNNQKELTQYELGTMETITHALSSSPDYTIIERGQLQNILKELGFQQSAFTDQKTSLKLGKLSGVDILVMGTIQTNKEKIRINAHFTDVQSGKILKTVQVTGSDIFDLQDNLAQEIIKQQNISLTDSQKTRISQITKPTNNKKAYEDYLKGKNLSFNFDDDSYEKKLKLFDSALSYDKDYTLARSSKAELQAVQAEYLKSINKEFNSLLEDAEKNINEVIAQNKDFAETHRALSIIYKLKGKEEESKSENEKSLSFDSNSHSTFHNDVGTAYWFIKNYQKATEELNEALRANPKDWVIYSTLALVNSDQKKYNEAEALFKKALELNPDASTVYNNFALIYMAQKKYDIATTMLNKSIELNGNSSAPYNNLAQIYMKQNKFSMAEELLKKAISVNPKSSSSYNNIGNIYMRQGKYEEALKVFRKAYELSNLSYYYTQIANIYSILGKYQESIKELEKVIDKKHEASLYVSLSDAYLGLKQYDKAQEVLKKGITLFPKESYLHSSLGDLYIIQNKEQDAENEFKEALKLNPEETSVYYSYSDLLKKLKRYDEAFYYYKKLLEIEPDNDYSLYKLAEYYHDTSNNQEALSTVDKSIAINPRNYSRMLRSKILINLSKDNEAINELNILLAEKPDYIEANKILGNIYLKNNNLTEAIKNLEIVNKKVKNKNSSSELAKAYFSSGVKLYNEGNPEKAIVYYKDSLELVKDDANTLTNLGAAYHAIKRYDLAVKTYQKAIEIKPDLASSHDNLGISLQALGKNTEAIAEYKKACELGSQGSCNWLKENKL